MTLIIVLLRSGQLIALSICFIFSRRRDQMITIHA